MSYVYSIEVKRKEKFKKIAICSGSKGSDKDRNDKPIWYIEKTDHIEIPGDCKPYRTDDSYNYYEFDKNEHSNDLVWFANKILSGDVKSIKHVLLIGEFINFDKTDGKDVKDILNEKLGSQYVFTNIYNGYVGKDIKDLNNINNNAHEITQKLLIDGTNSKLNELNEYGLKPDIIFISVSIEYLKNVIKASHNDEAYDRIIKQFGNIIINIIEYLIQLLIILLKNNIEPKNIVILVPYNNYDDKFASLLLNKFNLKLFKKLNSPDYKVFIIYSDEFNLHFNSKSVAEQIERILENANRRNTRK